MSTCRHLISPRALAPCVIALIVMTLAVGSAQSPRTDAMPVAADRRHVDPCELALRPRGQSRGLQGQCEPLGGGGAAKGDFNGDGIGDLAVGVPREDIGTIVDAGAVHVVYGTSNGLASAGNQLLHQNVDGVSGTAGAGDAFGWAVASGHFNDDTYSDLAVGVPNEDIGGLSNVGAVQVFYGSANGLTTVGDQFWDYQDLEALWGGPPEDDAKWEPAAGDQFGWSLAWADFNADGRGDLAIGIPNMNVVGTRDLGLPFTDYTYRNEDIGGVVALYGGLSSLVTTGVFFEYGVGEGGHFGLTLSAGDYNGDGAGDLAVGVPFFTAYPYDVEETGGIRVFAGAEITGLSTPAIAFLTQSNSFGIIEAFDRFGAALASGDFNGDGRDDLAVGIPSEDIINASQINMSNAGAVIVFRGTSTGLSPSQFLAQGVLPDTAPEGADKFGFSLAAADFNGDSRDDLAIGVPGEDFGGVSNAGLVQILYGSSTGLATAAAEIWHQDIAGIQNSAEDDDQFGFALTAWNFGRSAHADLAVGIPFEDVFNLQGKTLVNAGAVHVIYGSATGIDAAGNQLWTQNSLAGDGAENGDEFGRAVY